MSLTLAGQEQAEYKPLALMILTVFLPCLAPSQLGGVSLGTACYGIGYYTWLPVLDLLLDIGKILISVLSYKGPHKLSLIGRRRS